MSKVVLYMSMSVDGLITGLDDGMDHGLGVNESGCTTGCAPAAWIRVRTGPSTNTAQPCSTS